MFNSGSAQNPHAHASLSLPFTGTLFVVLCAFALLFSPAKANAAFTITDWALTPSTTQAGGHPNVNFHLDPDGAAGDQNGDDLKKVVVDFSAGMLGNPEAVSSANTCTTTKFNSDTCPSGGRIGTVSVQYRRNGSYFTMPGTVYKLTPDSDSAMTFGFIMRPSGYKKLFLKSSKVGGVATVRTGLDADYGLTATIDSIPRTLTTTGGSVTNVTISNITVNLQAKAGSNNNGAYFTYNPTRCSLASTRATMTSYLGVVITRTSSYTPTNCAAVPFTPTFTATPTSLIAGAPTGISATVTIPTAAATIQQSHIKNITATLPEGTGLNFPAIGAVAALCSDAQLNADTCPAGSKIGTASAAVPFLPPTMTGDIYLTARSTQIQFGYVLRGARGTKAMLKGTAMAEDPDGNSIGAVVARLINMPQAPYGTATLNFTANLLQNAQGPCTTNAQTITAVFNGYSGATATRTSSHTLSPCTPPPSVDTTITSGPSNPTNDNTPTFTFSSIPPTGTTFECKIDAGAFAACASPFTSAPLTDGTHNFQVRAIAGAGVDTTPASATFVVDTVGPVVTITSPTEGQSIPAGILTVAFTAVDATTSVTSTTCRVDAAAATVCTSPFTTSIAVMGSHSITIVATDAAGNTTTYVRNFVIPPPPPPNTTILTGPASVTNDNTPTFTFSSDQTATFQCRVDAVAFAACTTPFTTVTLAEGLHTFDVRATNANGTDATPASRTFTVDTVGPVVNISSPTEGQTLASSPVTVTFTAVDATTSVTGTTCSTDASPAAACASPFLTPSLAFGAHNVTVVATDAAGNTSVAVRGFNIAQNDFRIIGPVGPTNDNTPTFTFVGVPAGFVVECRVDAAAFAACASPHTTATLTDGAHTFQARLTSANGTDATPASFSFVVDTVGPVVNITSPTEGATVPLGPAAVNFTATDATTSVAGATCRTDAGSAAPCTSPYTTPALLAGSHSVVTIATDAAGNTTTAVRNFIAGGGDPETTITAGPTGPTNDNTPTFYFTSNVPTATFECRIGSAAFAPCSPPYNSTTLIDNSYTFEVRAVSGSNVDPTPATRSFTIDTVAPVITITSPALGATIPPGSLTVSFFVSEPATVTCRLDAGASVPCTSPVTFPITSGCHTITITAVDAAGNSSTVTRTWCTFELPTVTIVAPVAGAILTTPNVSVSFTTNAVTNALRCNLDGGAYAACTSPKSYAGLTDGTHTVCVIATSVEGQESPPACRTFKIDTTPPSVIITSPTEGQTIPSSGFTVHFSATDATSPPVNTTCRIDGGTAVPCTSPFNVPALPVGPHNVTIVGTDQAGWTVAVVRNFNVASQPNTTLTSGPPNPTNDPTPTFTFASDQPGTFECSFESTGFGPCTTPITLQQLTNGTYTFCARAVSGGGIDLTPACQTFTVDVVPPNVVIVSPVAGQTIFTSSFSASFSVSEPATVQCRLDSGPLVSCSSPFALSGLASGPHTFCVTATDAAGNSTTVCVIFNVLIEPPPSPVISPPMPPSTADTTPSISFSSPGTGFTYECRVDANAFAACTSPYTTPPLSDVTVHSFEVRTVNGAGPSPTATKTYFLVDTRPYATAATVTPTTTQAAAHPDVTATVSIQGAADPKSADVVLAHGLMGSLAAVPRCTPAQATAGTCPAASKIGSGSATAVSPRDGIITTTSADIFLVDPDSAVPGEAAEIAVKAIAPNGLGTVIAKGSVVLRNNGTNIAGTIDNIPTQTDLGNRFHLMSVSGTLLGSTGAPTHPLITNPSGCAAPANPVAPNPGHIGPFNNIIANSTAYDGSIAPQITVPYPTTGCTAALLPYAPVFSQTFTNAVAGGETGLVATLDVPMNHSSTFRARVIEPAKVGVNFPAFGSSGDQCAGASAPNGTPGVGNVPFNPAANDSSHPTGCPASSKVGTVVATTPALANDVTGDIYLIYKGTLPWLGVDIKPQAAYPNNPQGVNLRLLLTTALPQVDPLCDPAEVPCETQLAVDTRNLPDIPLTKVIINMNQGSRVGSSSGTTLSGNFLTFLPSGDPSCDPALFSQSATAAFYPYARQTTPVTSSVPVVAAGC